MAQGPEIQWIDEGQTGFGGRRETKAGQGDVRNQRGTTKRLDDLARARLPGRIEIDAETQQRTFAAGISCETEKRDGVLDGVRGLADVGNALAHVDRPTNAGAEALASSTGRGHLAASSDDLQRARRGGHVQGGQQGRPIGQTSEVARPAQDPADPGIVGTQGNRANEVDAVERHRGQTAEHPCGIRRVVQRDVENFTQRGDAERQRGTKRETRPRVKTAAVL